MAIVRELLVKIGFVTDKKAINATNSAITGFRTRFALAATAATYALSKLTGFFNDLAQASLEAKGLAATLGISIEELNALNKGFKKFDFNDAQIITVLSNLNQKFQDFRTGASDEIGKVADGLKFEVDRNAGPLKFFRDYLEALSKVDNEQQRIKVATAFFGKELAPLISNLSQDVAGLDTAIGNAFKANPDLSEQTQALKNYRESVKDLTNAWENFSLSLSKTVLPALTTLINYFEVVSDFYSGIFSGDKNLLTQGLKRGSALLDPAWNAIGLNHVSDFFRDFAKNNRTHLDIAQERHLAGVEGYELNPIMFPAAYNFLKGSTTSPSMNNNIEINVASGTEHQQLQDISQSVREAITDSMLQMFSQIQNNNPQVE